MVEFIHEPEAAKLLGLTKAQLVRIANRQEIPVIVLPGSDRRRMYLPEDLEAWALRHRQPANYEATEGEHDD